MKSKKLKTRKIFYCFIPLLIISVFFGGCTYAPGPPSELRGMGIFIIGWIIIILLSLILYITWKRKTFNKKNDENYVVNALNDMNKRLKKIEDKLESIKVKRKNNKKEE